jgi:hypothetical protein
MQAHESARRHEREREEEHPRVAAPVRRLPRRIAEDERDGADDAEDHEVRAVVLEMRIELSAKQERGEADQRQRGGDHDGDAESRRACTLSVRARTADCAALFVPLLLRCEQVHSDCNVRRTPVHSWRNSSL